MISLLSRVPANPTNRRREDGQRTRPDAQPRDCLGAPWVEWDLGHFKGVT